MHDIIFDIRHDIVFKDAFLILLCTAAADPRPALRADETDDDNEPGRAMDIDEGRGVDCRGAERHPGEQPGSQPRGQRAASDIRLHSVGV